MNIIVTGGCGFIGSHLCKKLIDDGNVVLCLDNLSTGNLENIDELMSNKNFMFVKYDVKENLQDFPDEGCHVDQIYHLACPASPIHYQKSSLDTLLTNIYGTINMLKTAEKCGARLLLTSTSEVYGDPLVSPQNEEYWGNVNPVGARSCYDEGKRVAETLCIEFNKIRKVDVRIARIFNTYGPRLHPDDGRVVSNFIVQALAGNPITVYGDGSQTRSFCYVDDQVNGLMKLMNTESNFPDLNLLSMPVNIGNPNEITINELAKLVLELTKSKSQIIFKSLPLDDPKKRNPDITRAKKCLNWEPVIPLKLGLEKTIEYFQSIKN